MFLNNNYCWRRLIAATAISPVKINRFWLSKWKNLLPPQCGHGPANPALRPAANNNGYFIVSAVKTEHGCSKHTMFGASGFIFASRRRWFCMVVTEDFTWPELRSDSVSCGSLGLWRELWWAWRPSWALFPFALLKKLVFFSRAKGKKCGFFSF